MLESTDAVPSFTVSLNNDGIARVVWAPASKCTLDEAKRTVAALDVLTERRVVPLLCDMRLLQGIDREARDFYQSTWERWSGMAMLTGSALTKMIANFSLGLMRVPGPTQVFTSEEAAIVWLRSLPHG